MSNDRTVRVRIAVAVNARGEWVYAGRVDRDKDLRGDAIESLYDTTGIVAVHWIEADVPLPVSETIEGRVVPETEGGS